ncbi:Crp/Fnr family transcriptional regulator [Steroidobacter sp.]|uniref:Crp/Fnr family transcriptional regulator n=1 Tax=Steroidobacter sp. TaxID=1978227 RepID=UPI001A47103D|nr:Crp/Fnr family transcriptional regulator [Steroidobacter sp.]MBL8270564.1 Crp/Fnr family transcriptional regulator [Steroidobacter sp.]
MPDPSLIRLLIRKLENFAELAEDEKRALQEAAGPVRPYAAHEDLLREGEQANGVAVVVSGFACRHKMLPDGRRQIIGYFLPGDMCDARVFILKKMDHTISTLAPSSVSVLPREAIIELTSKYPRLTRAFWWNTLVEEAIGRQWLVSIGQRTALERVAHLFCEVYVRLQSVGLATPEGCELPVTQSELADTVALSTVHVNRTLKELRRVGLVSMSSKALSIHDFAGLRALAMFDPSYLHLEGDGLIRDRASHALLKP